MDDTRILNSIRVLFEDRPFICQYDGCFYAAKRKNHLQVHMRLHTNEKPFKCDICDECFIQQSNLNTHKAKHEEKKWSCGICDSKFYEKSSLITHEKIHDKSTYFKCDFPDCDAEFSQESNLVTHKMRHRGDKPYICTFEYCDAAFSCSSALVIHKRSHTGEMPYVCEYSGCNMKFKQAGHLQVHSRTHTDEKPYKCSYENCDMAFTTSGNLRIHERVHSGNKPYICDICHHSFTTNTNLLVHINGFHNIDKYKRQKIKEEKVANALQLAQINYKRENYVDMSCFGGTNAREDFILDNSKGGIIVLEVDEYQHSEERTGYTVLCEMKRSIDIQNSLLCSNFNMPRLIIRFNPDNFKINNKLCDISFEKKINTLIQFIKNHNFNDSSPMLQFQYMFYDVDINDKIIKLKIFEHPDFYEPFVNLSLSPIISCLSDKDVDELD